MLGCNHQENWSMQARRTTKGEVPTNLGKRRSLRKEVLGQAFRTSLHQIWYHSSKRLRCWLLQRKCCIQGQVQEDSNLRIQINHDTISLLLLLPPSNSAVIDGHNCTLNHAFTRDFISFFNFLNFCLGANKLVELRALQVEFLRKNVPCG